MCPHVVDELLAVRSSSDHHQRRVTILASHAGEEGDPEQDCRAGEGVNWALACTARARDSLAMMTHDAAKTPMAIRHVVSMPYFSLQFSCVAG